MIQNQIKALSKQFFHEIVALRQHLHAHPELSFQEVQTGQFIFHYLQKNNITCSHGIAENGVVGIIEGNNPSKKIIALRADMDALPIQESNDLPYKSKHEGIMHACGHDVHTASLLGAARILQATREQWEGTVKLIFQPAEEKLPGGASIMIKEGVLQNPSPTSIIGQHVHPPLPVGKIGIRSGLYMASADELYLTIRGKGGHAAMPHDCIDPIAIAAQVITALQQIVSRHADPSNPSVLSFGKINSVGGATNVLPNEVKLEGTFRAMNETWRTKAHGLMRQMAEGISSSLGGSCIFTLEKGYPCLINEEKLTQRVRLFAEAFLGKDNVVDLPIRMTAEDFAYYSQVMPACFYRLGTGNAAMGITSPVHTSTFNIDENALETSIGLMAWLAIKELETHE